MTTPQPNDFREINAYLRGLENDSAFIDTKNTKIIHWKSPAEEMPPDQKRVAVIIEMENGSWWTTMAEHISARTVHSEDYLSDDCEPGNLDEYDEEKDCYWVKENWFESNLFDENNWVINRPILFWALIEKPDR